MDKKQTRYAAAIRVVNTFLITFASIFALNGFLYLEIPIYFMIIAIIAAIGLVIAVDICKDKPVFWIVLASAVLLLFIISVIFNGHTKPIISNLTNWINETLPWLREHVEDLGKTTQNFGRSLFIASVCIFISVIIVYPLTKIYITRFLLSILILAGIITLCVLDYDLNKVTILLLLMCFSFTAIETCNKQLEKYRSEKKPNSSLFLYPICLVIALATVMIPSKSQPIQWKPVRKLLQNISISADAITDRFQILFGQVPSDFSIEYNAINITEKKSTVDAQNRSTVIDVKPGVDMRSPLYLRGSVRNVYTGTGWFDESREILEEDAASEVYETLYSLRRNNVVTEQDEDFYHKINVTIKYQDLITKSLMYSPLHMNVEYEGKGSYDINSANIRFRRFKRTGWEYKQTYYETNWEDENFKNFLRSLDGFDYDDDTTDFNSLSNPKYNAFSEIFSSFIDVNREIYNENISKYLADRADKIEKVYGSVPNTLPKRVYDLADEITADCETEYDSIKAIESYFRDNDYQYTLEPNAMPKDNDFVDWFIFDEKQGYCTYYASAAAVLLRCAGIPSRYVEGIRIDSGLKGAVTYHANGDEVHAWCEAYLEGYGWIIVDPTPGYGGEFVKPWPRRQIINNSYNDAAEIEMMMNPPQQEIVLPEEMFKPTEKIDLAELARLEAEQAAARRRMWKIITISLLALIITGVIIAFSSYKSAKHKRYRKASNDEKIVMLMKDILMYISVTDKKMKENETVLEFVDRIGETYDFFEMKLRDAAMMYLRTRYSNKNSTNMDVLAVFRYRRDLRRNILSTTGLFARFKFQLHETI